MKIIGLTGPTGAGKGSLCLELEKSGFHCLDTDLVARQVVEKGKPCLLELCDFFGKGILLPDGNLDRKKLGAICFSDKEKLEVLNSITHKYITKEVQLWLDGCRADGAFAAVIDAPLLFESGEDALCDMTVAVLADKQKRKERIMSRDGISDEEAERRMRNQKDDEFFEKSCDYVIYNNGKLDFRQEANKLSFILTDKNT